MTRRHASRLRSESREDRRSGREESDGRGYPQAALGLTASDTFSRYPWHLD